MGANFFLYPEEAGRGGVAVWRISHSELGGRDRVFGDLDVVLQDEHSLIRRADEKNMTGVCRTACQDGGQGKQDESPADFHAAERDGFTAPTC